MARSRSLDPKTFAPQATLVACCSSRWAPQELSAGATGDLLAAASARCAAEAAAGAVSGWGDALVLVARGAEANVGAGGGGGGGGTAQFLAVAPLVALDGSFNGDIL
ncbi:hypothetical protein MNEG_13546 [Monoraphidium neglectum]|uniref:Uncharacterized protein n=1 Tax=Monoraphidium neglectum TaxID=145388 RepID=A0A0D2KEX0_9CHLO|nr:hypothetical protein MNEG_13546 [Monoraphidium neglectum]KIY94418.1 hypothetical protein MNEG_13546 [Monoraphidium neglectum]|eukprot:XP_013893438.1 hypothetical protein MNEG_13546 [Monoraphidium neglectum]